MKSTLKIDYSSRSDASIPVIKIIQPNEVFEDAQSVDYDVRDKLIRDFLVRPGYADRNYWFNLDTCFGNDLKEPTLFISTIAAIKEEDLFRKFRHAILNRFVSYHTNIGINAGATKTQYAEGQPIPAEIYNFNKITEFFDWLDKQEMVSWQEQQPDHVDSCRTAP